MKTSAHWDKKRLNLNLIWHKTARSPSPPYDSTHIHFRPRSPNAISVAVTLPLDWVAGATLPGLLCQQQEMQFTLLHISLFPVSLPLEKDTQAHERAHAQSCLGNVHPRLQRTGGVQAVLLRELKWIRVGQALPHIRIRGGQHGNSCWKHGLAGNKNPTGPNTSSQQAGRENKTDGNVLI